MLRSLPQMMLAALKSSKSFLAEAAVSSSLIFTPPDFFWGTKVFLTLVGEPFRPAQ